jgi:hypothetical protein
MAIRQKPQQTPAGAVERRIEELIEKGGSVATAEQPQRIEPNRTLLVQLRLDAKLIGRIDVTRRKRTVPPSRHAWMLEAILDKLQTEE